MSNTPLKPWREPDPAQPHSPSLLTNQPSAPGFERTVPDNGYVWWYLDGLSQDGQFGLTVIAFIGSVFSPYYAWARRQGRVASPERHVAINAVLYQPGGGKRWAMTERSGLGLQRSTHRFQLANSALTWSNDALSVAIDERCAPFGQRLRGQIELHSSALNSTAVCLEPKGQHIWHPIAPRARVSVQFENPKVRWEGSGYFDHNRGDTPLDQAFDYWSWSRSHHESGTDIDYEFWSRGAPGTHGLCSVTVDATGTLAERNHCKRTALPGTGWRIDRNTRIPECKVQRTLEDTPFYARTQLQQSRSDAQVICESLDLTRFRSPWVQMLLPFRMPRRA